MTEEAYLKAAGGSGMANARQVYYAARSSGGGVARPGVKLDDQYFTQRLLPDFVAEHPELSGGWDIVWDARGHLD